GFFDAQLDSLVRIARIKRRIVELLVDLGQILALPFELLFDGFDFLAKRRQFGPSRRRFLPLALPVRSGPAAIAPARIARGEASLIAVQIVFEDRDGPVSGDPK